jgi:hypothetical protein
MEESNNPIKPGLYQCEAPGCNKKIDASEVRCVFGSFDLILCPDCYNEWLSRKDDKQLAESRVFFGLESKYIPEAEGRIKLNKKPEESPLEFDERMETKKAGDIKKRNDCNYRKRMREYMQERNDNPVIKTQIKGRYEDLKGKFKDCDVIDIAPVKCPQCSNPKTGKAGFVYCKDGKYQRRICSKCGFAYTEDWSKI